MEEASQNFLEYKDKVMIVMKQLERSTHPFLSYTHQLHI